MVVETKKKKNYSQEYFYYENYFKASGESINQLSTFFLLSKLVIMIFPFEEREIS